MLKLSLVKRIENYLSTNSMLGELDKNINMECLGRASEVYPMAYSIDNYYYAWIFKATDYNTKETCEVVLVDIGNDNYGFLEEVVLISEIVIDNSALISVAKDSSGNVPQLAEVVTKIQELEESGYVITETRTEGNDESYSIFLNTNEREPDMVSAVKDFNESVNYEMNPIHRTLDISSEIGELNKELLIATGYGREEYFEGGDNADKISDEYGDVLYSVLSLGLELGINPEEAILRAIEKYKNRMQS